jgi:hypothetical protein
MEISYENKIEDTEEYWDFVLKSKEGILVRILVIFLFQVGAIIGALVIFLFVFLISFGSWMDGLLFAFM